MTSNDVISRRVELKAKESELYCTAFFRSESVHWLKPSWQQNDSECNPYAMYQAIHIGTLQET